MSSWEDYRKTGKGFALEMARVPGELSVVFGLVSMNPFGLLLAGVGALEIALCVKLDGKAYDAFVDKRDQTESDSAPKTREIRQPALLNL